ncbi:LOB domain-containing protein 40-like [Musa acuminata AAA Group]|uniref:LOB domain-containing protein 40-like n=1 Tax=Musa acuminata AAA Group TaxID=214697 RepID=UPI0031E215F7
MRMSCNGCRVLRKGCSENCSIRPCLQWIKSPESQANATVFLAKFYGRAGLMNLINAGPDHLRPAIFRSLLYEACGRIVNPIYGSVGLLWSGSWQLCQAAVEAVLKGAPIVQIPYEKAASTPAPPLKAYDIRHVSKDSAAARAAAELHKVNKPRSRFKRSGAKTTRPDTPLPEFQRARSHESAASHATEPGPSAAAASGEEAECRENESMASADTAEEASHVSQGEPQRAEEAEQEEEEISLELTLGLEPASRSARPAEHEAAPQCDVSSWDAVARTSGLGLALPPPS